jgi:predicted CoA-binding protein
VSSNAYFANPDAASLCRELAAVRMMAVVGLSRDETRPSHRIDRAMQRHGFRVVPVRPLADRILGEKAVAGLRELPGPVDLVNVFRQGSAIDGIVDDCLALGLPRLWIQEGIVNEPAARRAVASGVWTVMDRCILRDFNGLCGGSRAGFTSP